MRARRASAVPAALLLVLLALLLALFGGGAFTAQAPLVGAAPPVSVSAPDAAAPSRHLTRLLRADGTRTRQDGPGRTTAEQPHSARPLLLPPRFGAVAPPLPHLPVPWHGAPRALPAHDTARTAAPVALPYVRGPPGTAGIRSRPTSPPVRPS